ncbi:MAG: hypothetical protein GWO79_00070 [Actinobacteria bacterium]|nr:hypothetical protein [Actinomycetota bacterium]
MARILYGVAGEGSGHSSRAKEIINYLEGKGHKIKVISYDKGYKNLSPYFDVEKIFGLHFAYKDNKVRYIPTVLKNLGKAPKAARSINKVLKIIDEFKPWIIFSDFEPISGIAANIKNIPLISIDNQHRLTNTKIEYPKKYKQDALAAKTITNLMIFNSKACLVTAFAKTEITNKKTFLFPPILRKEILETKTKQGNYILVYLTSPFQGLIDLLKIVNKKFIVYGFNRNAKEKNLIFKKAGEKRFLNDLANCEGIIANAGFTLITEGLYLKKPYLALPVAGQFEQILNAFQIEKLGYGKYWDELNKEKIESFLYNLDFYKNNLKKYKKENNSKIFKKIDELIKEI